MTRKGHGNRPNATRQLDQKEIDLLCETNKFGTQESVALQRTIWWLLTMHNGWWAKDESRQLKWGDIQLEEDLISGKERIVWLQERSRKTNSGEKETGEKRAYQPAIWSTGDIRCPVTTYKEFKRRPESSLTPDASFYLQVNHTKTMADEAWYLNRSLGKNKIGEFLASAAKLAQLGGTKNIANHSGRKTGIGRLLNAEVPESFVVQHSGHKRIEPLKHYIAI